MSRSREKVCGVQEVVQLLLMRGWEEGGFLSCMVQPARFIGESLSRLASPLSHQRLSVRPQTQLEKLFVPFWDTWESLFTNSEATSQ